MQLPIMHSLNYEEPEQYISIRRGYHPISREDMKYLRQSKKQSPNCVFLGNSRWTRFKINILFTRIKTWNIKNGLFLQNNKHPRILKIISSIDFPKLRHLNLSENNIQSLAWLQNLSAPSLRIIVIQNNRFFTINTLRKAFFPRLKTISLNNNPIREYSLLSEMKMNFETEIWIGRRTWEYESVRELEIETQYFLRGNKLENRRKKLMFFSQFLNIQSRKKQASQKKEQ